MKRYALIIVGVFVGIGYYHYTKVASLVGSRAGPAAYRAAARSSAAVSAFGQRGLARSFSQTTNTQPSSLARLQSVLQSKSSTQQLQKPQSARTQQPPLGIIRGRMMQPKTKGPSGVRHMSQVSARQEWIPEEGVVIPQSLVPLVDKGGILFLSESRAITDPMLKHAGINPADVTIIESEDPLIGKVYIRQLQWDGEVAKGFERRNVKYTVIHPRIIKEDGTVDPHAIAVAAHEFMHVKNKDPLRGEEMRKMFALRKKQLGPLADRNTKAEISQFNKLREEQADKDAALLYPGLHVAYYLAEVMQKILESNLAKVARNESFMCPFTYKLIAYKDVVDVAGERRDDLIHPPRSVRRDYLTSIAEKQTQKRNKEEYEKELASNFLGTIFPQKPISEFEHIKQRYPPKSIKPAPPGQNWIENYEKSLREHFLGK